MPPAGPHNPARRTLAALGVTAIASLSAPSSAEPVIPGPELTLGLPGALPRVVLMPDRGDPIPAVRETRFRNREPEADRPRTPRRVFRPIGPAGVGPTGLLPAFDPTPPTPGLRRDERDAIPARAGLAGAMRRAGPATVSLTGATRTPSTRT